MWTLSAWSWSSWVAGTGLRVLLNTTGFLGFAGHLFCCPCSPLGCSGGAPGWLVILLGPGTREVGACQCAPSRKAAVKKPCCGLWNLNCSQFQLRDVTVTFCCEAAIWTMTVLCGLKGQGAGGRRSVCRGWDWALGGSSPGPQPFLSLHLNTHSWTCLEGTHVHPKFSPLASSVWLGHLAMLLLLWNFAWLKSPGSSRRKVAGGEQEGAC